jgi:hypothetical protein
MRVEGAATSTHAFNRLRDIATDERRDNFDIFLPHWLAKYNKHIFGALYVAGVTFALVQWMRTSP